MSTLLQSAILTTYPGERLATSEPTPPGYRRERERLAVLEAQIAQTCYELSRLRAEHRRIRGRLALLGEPGPSSPRSPSGPE